MEIWGEKEEAQGHPKGKAPSSCVEYAEHL